MKNFLLGRPFGWIITLYYLYALTKLLVYFGAEMSLIPYKYAFYVATDPDLIIFIVLSYLIIPPSIARGVLLFRIKGFTLSHLAYFVLNPILLLISVLLLLAFIGCAVGTCF